MARLLINSKLGEPGSMSDSLAAEINALHHELRRVRDDLERAGGSSQGLEAISLLLITLFAVLSQIAGRIQKWQPLEDLY